MRTRILLLFILILLSCQIIFSQTASSSIIIKVNKGIFLISGVVSAEQTRNIVIEQIKAKFGNNTDFNQLKVVQSVIPFDSGWQKDFEKSLSKIRNWNSGIFIFTKNKGDELYPALPKAILEAKILLKNESKSVKLTDYPNKTIVLFFLESWCSPCIQQADILKNFYSEILSEDVEIIGVSTEPDEKENFREFIRRNNYNYKMGWADEKLLGSAVKISDFQGIPQTFLIRDNKLYGIFIGSSPKVIKKLKEEILRVSKEK